MSVAPSLAAPLRSDVYDAEAWGAVMSEGAPGAWGPRCDGLHRIVPARGGAVDILVENLAALDRPVGARRFLVCLAPAIRSRADARAPFFFGRGLAARLDMTLVSIADPSLALAPDLMLAWYAGAAVAPDLPATLAATLDGVAARLDAHPIVFGASGGGFAALTLATELTRPASLAVVNPQTDLSCFNAAMVRRYLEVAFGAQASSDDPGDLAAALRRVGVRHDVTAARLPPTVELLYLQNMSDWHVRAHAEPFLQAQGLIRSSDAVFSDGDGRAMYFGAWGQGHAGLPTPALAEALSQLAMGVAPRAVASALEGGFADVPPVRARFDPGQPPSPLLLDTSAVLEDGRVVVRSAARRARPTLRNPTFAFYLQSDGETIVKRGYARAPAATFDPPPGHGALTVRSFVRDENGARVSKVTPVIAARRAGPGWDRRGLSDMTPTPPGAATAPDPTLAAMFPPPAPRHASQASRLILDGVIDMGRYEAIPIGDSLWRCGPQDDRMWLWTLHAFLPLDCLIACGEAETAARLVRQWEEECADHDGEFPWHDHATALRLDRLSHMAAAMEGCRFDALAARHAEVLMDEAFYERHTNHGFDQALALIAAAVVFRDQSAAARWRATGLARLADEIRFAFTEEGVHVENSPGYHAGMIANMERARTVTAAADAALDVDLEAFGDGALRFLAWMTRPDRFLAYLGDTTRRRAAAPDSLRGAASWPMLRWAVSGGGDGAAPTETGCVFEKSGYAAYRSRWSPWAGHTHIVMKCGFLSSYHRHDDDLTILLHAHGEDWLIDSGLYGHNQSDPVRVYMRSALAHNVPWLANAPARRRPPAPGKTTLTRVARPDAAFAVTAETAMYQGGVATRTLLVTDPDRFEIRDALRFPDAAGPAYWLFHTPADKGVRTSRGAFRIMGRTHDLVARIADDDPPPIATHRGDQPTFPSLVSVELSQTAPSRVIVIGPTSPRALRINFRFYPHGT